MARVSERIREAASVVAVREGENGPEVLVLERGAASRFLPSYVVFPGGAVERGDSVLAQRWFADPEDAVRAAAVRELVEEAGLALTSEGLVGGGETDPLERVHVAPPTAERLSELCHWIAPQDVPVRFDARYFAVEAPVGLEPTPDGGEAAHAWWATPRSLLEEWKLGSRRLYWPTWYTMTRLAECDNARAVLRLRFETREPDPDEVERFPRSVFWED